MSASPLRVLLAVDGSDYSDSVVGAATHLFGEGATHFIVLSVVERPAGPGTEPGMEGEIVKAERERLESLHAHLVQAHFGGMENIQSMVMDGRAAQTICAQAESLAVDVIVMGSRGRGKLESALLGSVSEDVIHGTNVPVVIVKARSRLPPSNQHDAAT